jgi:hypothetical protein
VNLGRYCDDVRAPRDVRREKGGKLTTFYVKTAHAGGNNNSLDLTEEQEYQYNMTFQACS